HDFDITYALAILHDVGYSKMPKGYNPYDLKIRKAHSKESSKIAKVILEKVNFPKSKRKKTLWLIEHHDDWAFGKSLEDPEWRIFTDFDFSWEASRKGFDVVRKFLNQNRREFLKTVQADYKIKQKRTPFFLTKSKKLFLEDLRYWKERLIK
ncbi:HD domain-containing protein, partial [Candidatus Woesearchaeota archaeon]|nr:HD domain-containing protein [Candidatus Woesearchaeota archaeon]